MAFSGRKRPGEEGPHAVDENGRTRLDHLFQMHKNQSLIYIIEHKTKSDRTGQLTISTVVTTRII